MCWNIFGILPFASVLLMPILGPFYGKEPILRLSIFLLGQSSLTSVTARIWVLAEQFVQLAILITALSLRITLIPYPLIWVYDKVLFLTEPVWQIFEALGVVHLTMSLSQVAADNIDDEPVLAKSVILTMTGVSYSLLLWLLWGVIGTDSMVYIWAAVGILFIIAVLHFLCLTKEAGIISDVAVLGACSMAFLYDLCFHRESGYKLVEIPDNWRKAVSSHSYAEMLVHIFRTGLVGPKHVWSYFSKLFSPWFLCTSLARVCCVLLAVELAKHLLTKLKEWRADDFSDSEEAEDEENFQITSGITKSPLLIKAIVIFVYTQFLICHLHKPIYGDSSWLSWLQSWFPSGRWVQIVIMNLYYVYRLYILDEEL